MYFYSTCTCTCVEVSKRCSQVNDCDRHVESTLHFCSRCYLIRRGLSATTGGGIPARCLSCVAEMINAVKCVHHALYGTIF